VVYFNKRASLLSVLCCLTLLNIFAQLSFFIIHNHAAELLDNLISSSIADNIYYPAIITPLLAFIGIQCLAYVLFIIFIWFIAASCAELFRISDYVLGIFFWMMGNVLIFTLNAHFFPDSFFAGLLQYIPFNESLLWISGIVMGAATVVAYYQVFRAKKYYIFATVYFSLTCVILIIAGLNNHEAKPHYQLLIGQTRPNVILIGVDSLRPDFISYFNQQGALTPQLDQFLKTAVTFTEAYTPLARTFPAWISILTGKYPKNSHARINLDDARPVMVNDTLAKHLQNAGYETIYATDEKRFSNITADYGFDRLIGPGMGLNDFILGGLSDFPLSNLMINLPLGPILFPYNYANRAAAITYEPNTFLQLVKMGLHHRSNKPLFLAVHFCVTHWPFTWANDHQGKQASLSQRYRSSVEKADQQVGELMKILQKNGLLENSLVILLSDHGTSLGLPGDRLIDKKQYQGPQKRLSWIMLNRLSTASSNNLDIKHSYSINTTYGQGTDVLSLKQYQVLLAMKYFGKNSAFDLKPQHLAYRSSLLDIAPTVLDFLQLSPLNGIDGTSLQSRSREERFVRRGGYAPTNSRPLFLETGFSISEIETDHIEIEKVVNRTIHLYQMDPQNGRIFVKPSAAKGVLENKQRAVLLGPWILAYYPRTLRSKFIFEEHYVKSKNYILPAYYVLANIKTGEWTLGLDTAFAQKAPVQELLAQLRGFYRGEI